MSHRWIRTTLPPCTAQRMSCVAKDLECIFSQSEPGRRRGCSGILNRLGSMGCEPVFGHLYIWCSYLGLVPPRQCLELGPMNLTIRGSEGGSHLLDRPAKEPQLYLRGISHEILPSYLTIYTPVRRIDSPRMRKSRLCRARLSATSKPNGPAGSTSGIVTFQVDTKTYRRISGRRLLLMAATRWAGHAATPCHCTTLATFVERCDQGHYELLKTDAPQLAALCSETSRRFRTHNLLRWPMLLSPLAQQNHSSRNRAAMIETFWRFKSTVLRLFLARVRALRHAKRLHLACTSQARRCLVTDFIAYRIGTFSVDPGEC